MTTSRFKGVYTALVTPFKNGEVDYEAFRSLCQRQIQSGVAGLVPCGTTGETPALTDKEWQTLISISVEESNGRPVIAGCGSNSTAVTVDNIRRAKALGADAGLVVFPYYNKPNMAGLVAHVQAASSQGLPIVLYHVPGRTGQRLTGAQLETLCKINGVVGLKEATGDVALGQELLNRLSGTAVSLLSGDDFTFAALVAMGFDGVISVVSNPAPQLTCEWYQAADSGDVATLRKMRQTLLPVVAELFSESNPLPCKAIMATMNLLQNEARLPLMAIEQSGNWGHLR
jgi:4-hydroxy-tetrahydrodipicolinate synthase